jgi:acetyl-CoA carboxylase biotin carboxyl carrier protein
MRDDRIEHLIRLVEKSQITELEIQEGWGRRIRISKTASSSSALPPMVAGAAPAPTAAPTPQTPPGSAGGSDADADDDSLIKVVAPMVGTFYRASSPDNPPYVEMGTRVEPGQTLCIIEAMKIMNEIPSEVSGSIRKILVENGQPVEFGQTLFLIEKPT